MTKRGKIFLAAFAAASLLAGAVGLAACGEKEKTPEVHAHNYGEWEIVAPTDTATGSAKKVCLDCEEGTEGHEVTVTLPALTDEGYTKSGDTATCEDGGEATYTVTVDGNTVSFKGATAAKGHAYHEHEAVAETCETDGNTKYYTCDNCTKVFDAEKAECAQDAWVIAKHHVFEEHAAVAETCTTDGNTKYYTCENCTKVFDENQAECEANAWVIAKHHVYEEHAAQDATCTAAGNKLYYTCEKCDKVFDEDKTECEQDDWVLEATGHTYHWTATQEPTATATGSAKADCSLCGTDNLKTAVLPTLTAGDVSVGNYTYDAVPATCEEDGEEYYTTTEKVTEGGSLTFQVTIPAIRHMWVCADPPEALEAGGTVSATCANANCGETREFSYTGTLAQTGTVTIEKTGQYYIKQTSGAADIIFSIPIEKAGKYRVEFTNLDTTGIGTMRRPIVMATYPTTINVNSATKSNVAQAKAVVPFSVRGDATILTGETIKPTYNNTKVELCWFEAQVDDSFVGGTIMFSIAKESGIMESSPRPFLFNFTMEEEKVLQEGDNSVVITETSEAVDEYLFESAAGGWYEISIDETTKTAAGVFAAYLNGTDAPVLDSAEGLAARFEVEASSTNKLLFMASNLGTYTVKLAKSEKPAPTLKVGVVYEGSTGFSDGSDWKFSMTVDQSVEEGEYTLWFPFSSNKTFARTNDSPFSVSINGAEPVTIAMNFRYDKFEVKITVKGGDVLTVYATKGISGSLHDLKLS